MFDAVIVTQDPRPIDWFIQLSGLNVMQHPPNKTVYFHYKHGQMHLHTLHQKIHLSLAQLLPKDIAQHALYKLIRQHTTSCIIDCTGGLGRDSLIALYAASCPVITFERNNILALALRWLQHSYPGTQWEIQACDAKQYQKKGGLWLVDPMFPVHPKIAKSQNRMQIIQSLVPTSEDDVLLIQHAQSYADKLFIKKPLWQQSKSQFGLWSEVPTTTGAA